jgi:hypothetical protein
MLAYSIRCNLEDLENRKADIEAEIKMVQLRHEIEWLEKVLKAMKAMEAEGELGCCRAGPLGSSQDTPKGADVEQ